MMTAEMNRIRAEGAKMGGEGAKTGGEYAVGTCTSKLLPRHARNTASSSGDRNVIFSEGALAERTFPRDTFLNPKSCRMSS
jgi:hypothetical protein